MIAVRSEAKRNELVRRICDLKLPFRYELETDLRSLEQNALSHAWYGEIWKQGREMTTPQARRWCKWHLGVPIVRAGDADYSAACEIFDWVPYEKILDAMDLWPVTRLMSPDQFSEYLNAMQEHWGRQHIRLTSLDRGAAEYPEFRRAQGAA